MTRKLHIADDLSLPLDAATQAIAIVGQRGMGKTHLSTVFVEELVKAAVPTAVIDPLGVFRGLRSSSDGKREGLPVVILGGEQGDVPLEPTSGKVIADWVVEERRPCVLDLSEFRKGEQRQFATDFAEELYRKNRQAMHLVVDECDMFCPQRPMPGEQRMLGAFEDLVRRGRARGIGITLATQRPAVVHKDCLTQVSVLVALRLSGPQDRGAIEDWIRYHGGEEERRTVLASLPSLPVGTAWFWSPGWLGILQRVKVRQRETFDSSATPKVGEKRAQPAKLAPVDLEALRARVAETIERAKAEDPKALRARVAALEQKLATVSAAPSEPVEVDVLRPSDVEKLVAIESQLGTVQDSLQLIQKRVDELFEGYRARGEKGAEARRPVVPVPAPPVAKPSRVAVGAGPGEKLASGERRILTVLAQSGGRATKRKIALLAGYAVSGGGFANYLSALRGRGHIDGRGELELTPAGRKALGTWEPIPTGAAAVQHWVGELGKAEGLVLQALADARGRELTKEEVAKRTGYEASGGGFANALSRLRTLELIEGRGSLRLAEELR